MLAATADCEGSVKQKGCGVISRIYGAEGLGERQKKKKKAARSCVQCSRNRSDSVREKTGWRRRRTVTPDSPPGPDGAHGLTVTCTLSNRRCSGMRGVSPRLVLELEVRGAPAPAVRYRRHKVSRSHLITKKRLHHSFSPPPSLLSPSYIFPHRFLQPPSCFFYPCLHPSIHLF